MRDLETIYALGLDEVMFGDENGNFRDPTPEEGEAIAAIASDAFIGDHASVSPWLGLFALVRTLIG